MFNLRDIRKSRGITMKELGELVGVSESAIGNYEKGRRIPNYEMLLKLSEALNCSVGDFLAESSTEVSKEKAPAPESRNGLSDSDMRLITWFRSLPQEKQKAILIAQDAPEDLL